VTTPDVARDARHAQARELRETEQTSQTLAALGTLENHLASRSYGRLLLHNRSTLSDLRPFLMHGWRVKLSYTYVVPLGNLSAQWDRVDAGARRWKYALQRRLSGARRRLMS